jgi:hypothetical protein
MEWPGPSGTRSASGAPGPEYWQQRADYTIAVSLDTTRAACRRLGDDPLHQQLARHAALRLVAARQNLYRPGSKGSMLFPADSRWGVRGFRGRVRHRRPAGQGRPATMHVDDTMGRIDLEQPIAPKGGRLTVTMSYAFRVPEHGSDRMGRDGTLYEIAQWYPRMAVYDDIRGWNTDPYFGQGEFYLEYGDIDYSVTAPAGYTIAGSGVLQNAATCSRPCSANGSLAHRAPTPPSPSSPTTRPAPQPTSGTRTWRFRAQNVRDVAWAGAPDFRWDAVNANGVLAQAYYQIAKAGKAWEQAAEQTAWTIRNYSELFYKYPYPQATSVAGTVGGMEYPMFVMVHYGDPRTTQVDLRDREPRAWARVVPMIVGSNERRYAWQDEGFNTYINAFALERRTPGTSPYPGYVNNWRQTVENRIDAPLMTPPDRIAARALGALGYRKPAVVLLALRDNVVGRATFDRAFREYTQRWAFKHPSPGDFFRTIENVSGMDLGWYWRSFWYSTDVLDIGIDNVSMRQQQGQNTAVIALRRYTPVPFPIRLRLLFRTTPRRTSRCRRGVVTGRAHRGRRHRQDGRHRRAALAGGDRSGLERDERCVGNACSSRRVAGGDLGGLSGEIGGRPLP